MQTCVFLGLRPSYSISKCPRFWQHRQLHKGPHSSKLTITAGRGCAPQPTSTQKWPSRLECLSCPPVGEDARDPGLEDKFHVGAVGAARVDWRGGWGGWSVTPKRLPHYLVCSVVFVSALRACSQPAIRGRLGYPLFQLSFHSCLADLRPAGARSCFVFVFRPAAFTLRIG